MSKPLGEMETIKDALREFERSLKAIERDSKEALALAIFINGCFDSKSFSSNKYNALTNYPQAKQTAEKLRNLCSNNMASFHKAIQSAHTILLTSDIIDPNFILSS
ncbi:hypothetical protein [Vibrio sp. 10N.222.54.B11]|uniref:hypothetical protein n=1 Tax=Vibrio sp. 10N.222.54.B11 TaxID=3229635 RepID=UPI003552DD31